VPSLTVRTSGHSAALAVGWGSDCANMDDGRLTIEPPVYLIGKMYSCWRCGARMPVVALLAPKVDGTQGEVCILSEIRQLPDVVLAYIQGRVPTFKTAAEQVAATATMPRAGDNVRCTNRRQWGSQAYAGPSTNCAPGSPLGASGGSLTSAL